jgi:WD40 repeat protein
VVADTTDGRVAIVDVASGVHRGIVGERPVPITEDGVFAAALAFTPTGQLLVGRLDDTLSVVDPATGVVLRTHEVPGAAVNAAIAVTSDGRIITSGDRSIAAVDGSTGAVLWSDDVTAPQPGTGCAWLAVSELIGTVYCGGHWGYVLERDLGSGVPTGRRMEQSGASVAVTESGTRLVTIGGARPIVSTWRLDGTGAVQRLIARGMEIQGGPSAGYSPSGERLLVKDRRPFPPSMVEVDQQVSVWDVESDRETAVIEGPIANSGWAGEDRIVAFFPDAGAFQLVDVDDGSVVATLPTTASGTWTTHAGTRLNVAVEDEVDGGEVWTYDTASGERIEPTLTFDDDLLWLSASPDGSRLALAFVDPASGKQTASILDAESGAVISSAPLAAAPIAMLNNSEFIGALGDNRVARYSVESMEPIGTIPGPAGGTHAIRVSEDGRTLLLASGPDQTAMVFDLPSGVRLGDPLRAEYPRLRPDGVELALDVEDGILLWDLDPGRQFEAVCRIAGRDLTEGEWATYLADFGEPRSTCDLS